MAKKKEAEIYVVEQLGYSVSIAKRDKTGKIVTKRDRAGIVDEVSRLVKFVNVENNASKGYISKFTIDDSTDKYEAEAVRNAYENDPQVMTEKEFIKKTNIPQYNAEVKLEVAEKALTAEKAKSIEKDVKLDEAQEQIKNMGEKLNSLMNKGK